MEYSKPLNPEFVEWMRNRIKIVGEEIIKRADRMTFEGFDAMTELDINIRITTMTDEILWPSINMIAHCGETEFMDRAASGTFDPYPPNQFLKKENENGRNV